MYEKLFSPVKIGRMEVKNRVAMTSMGVFPLGVRLSAEEFLADKGNDLAATCRIAEKLEEAGVDFLDISSTIPDSEMVGASMPCQFEADDRLDLRPSQRRHWQRVEADCDGAE